MSIPNDTNEPSLASAVSRGSASRWTGVPVAWAAVGQNGVPLWLAYQRQDAEGAVVGKAQVVPLYRQPQPALTDEERKAIEQACDEGRWFPRDYHYIHTLRALLERLT